MAVWCMKCGSRGELEMESTRHGPVHKGCDGFVNPTTFDTRPPWEDYFFQIAHTVSSRATCPRASVGCVVVRDKRILVTGYNGAPTGQKHCTEAGCHMADGHCRRAVHAEMNAVATAARHGISLDHATIYVTHQPCDYCYGVLLNAGVKTFRFADVYAGEAFLGPDEKQPKLY